MTLISATNVSSLHHAIADQTKSLKEGPSRRYQYAKDSSSDQLTIIPDPSLFEPSTSEGLANASPTTRDCAIHLEMLEVFHTFRNDIIQSADLDTAFSIVARPQIKYRKEWDGRKFVGKEVSIRDPDFEEKRRNKWWFILRIAAVRFQQWIQVVDNHLTNAKINPDSPLPGYLLLPPLDVLIVWHAFLLNCDDFKDHCDRWNLPHVQEIDFPWSEIHTAINPETWQYTLDNEHKAWLSKFDIDPDIVDAIASAGKDDGPVRKLLSAFDKYSLADAPKGDHGPLFATLREARSYRTTTTQLVENVERQVIFVDKMHSHRWIRSPAIDGTLRRAVDRYDKFLCLFRLHPDQFLVPTLDVDLVWHTHQCSAQRYRMFVTQCVGRFINHEDKVGWGTLDDGFSNTERWYRMRFGERYQVCLCWSCEAILSAVEEVDEDALDEGQVPLASIAENVERRVHYYREVEVTRRLGRPLPIWNHR